MNYFLLLIITFSITFFCYSDKNVNVKATTDRIKKEVSHFTSPISYYYTFTSRCNIIETAIGHFMKHTCIIFKRTWKKPKGVAIILRRDKNNWIKDNFKNGKPTILGVNQDCTNSVGCIKHLVGRALGMIPQVKRSDRDKFVDVLLDKLKSSYNYEYKKVSSDSCLVKNRPFDFGSIINYPLNYGSKDKKTVYTSKLNKYYTNMLGQRQDFSHSDIKLLNDLYCSDVCDKLYNDCILSKDPDTCKPTVCKCKNGGYPDPKNCQKCKCPNGFIGVYCDAVEHPSGECGKTKLQADKGFNYLKIKSTSRCTYLITSKPGTNIEIFVMKARLSGSKICTSKLGLEIRKHYDNGETGLYLCGYVHWFNMTSYQNQVLIQYNGKHKSHFADIKYTAVNAK